MVKKFKVPFASGGNTNTVPNGAQVNGAVSYTTGFTSDYEKAYNEADAKDVERMDMNGILNDITGAIGDLQTNGASVWTLDGAPHPRGALVWYQNKLYQSRKGNNSATPSHGADWYEVDLQARIMPIGATYMQFPGRPSPAALWGGTWQELYANDSVFFRTGGSASNPFDGSIQQDEIRGHSHSATTASAGSHSHSASTNNTGGHSHTRGTMNITGQFNARWESSEPPFAPTDGAFKLYDTSRVQRGIQLASGGASKNMDFDASRSWSGSTSSNGTHNHAVSVDSAGAHIHSVTVNSTGGTETRPKNITIKIWVRTA
jgi:hypothetical protein